MDEKKNAERAVERHTDGVTAAMLAPALADNPELDGDARKSAEKVARENAERMAAENAGTDAEQAARGHIPAAAKNGFPDAYPEPTVLKPESAAAPRAVKSTAAAKKSTGTSGQ